MAGELALNLKLTHRPREPFRSENLPRTSLRFSPSSSMTKMNGWRRWGISSTLTLSWTNRRQVMPVPTIRAVRMKRQTTWVKQKMAKICRRARCCSLRKASKLANARSTLRSRTSQSAFLKRPNKTRNSVRVNRRENKENRSTTSVSSGWRRSSSCAHPGGRVSRRVTVSSFRSLCKSSPVLAPDACAWRSSLRKVWTSMIPQKSDSTEHCRTCPPTNYVRQLRSQKMGWKYIKAEYLTTKKC